MKNLGTFLTADNVRQALEMVIQDNRKLLTARKFALVYQGRRFPPKEIARIAAQLAGVPKKDISNYRLNGGQSINHHFQKIGFRITQEITTVIWRLKVRWRSVSPLCQRTKIYPSDSNSQFAERLLHLLGQN